MITLRLCIDDSLQLCVHLEGANVRHPAEARGTHLHRPCAYSRSCKSVYIIICDNSFLLVTLAKTFLTRNKSLSNLDISILPICLYKYSTRKKPTNANGYTMSKI